MCTAHPRPLSPTLPLLRTHLHFPQLRGAFPCPRDPRLVLCCDDEGAVGIFDMKVGRRVSSLLPAGSGQGKAFQCLWSRRVTSAAAVAPDVLREPLLLCGTAESMLVWRAGDVLPELKCLLFPFKMDGDECEGIAGASEGADDNRYNDALADAAAAHGGHASGSATSREVSLFHSVWQHAQLCSCAP